ncbi:MAG TPA: phosphatase PAP2 family protein, partial [Acidimicrobiales bacterium]|nr:phosphatase PAP2 family protein [Acidimicrobiales bacterium]
MHGANGHRAGHRTGDHLRLPSWLEVVEQFLLIFGAALLYFAVRGYTEGSADLAVEHGLDVLRFERRLGLDLELGIQALVIDQRWIVTVANWVYIWGHWPVI